MTVPNQEPNYYDTGRTRRAFLLGAGAALVLGAGGFAVWATGALAGDGEDDLADGDVDGEVDVDDFEPDAPVGADRGNDDEDQGEDEPVGFTSMAMVGDSITQGSTPALEQVLGDRGFTQLDIEGKTSRRIEVGDGGGAPLSGIRQLFTMIGSGISPQVWVIALGTNDVGLYAGREDYLRLIDAMVTMLPEDQPLVWVDVYRPEHLEATQLFNELLRERLGERGNAVVADWYSRASDPDLDVLRDDGIHPNNRGNLVFADLVSDALAQLAS